MGITQRAFKKDKYSGPIQRDSDSIVCDGVLTFCFCFCVSNVGTIDSSHHLEPSSKDRWQVGEQLREIQITISWGCAEMSGRVSPSCLLKASLHIFSLIMSKLPGVIQPLQCTTTGASLSCDSDESGLWLGCVSSLVQWNINSVPFTMDRGRFLVRMKSSCSWAAWAWTPVGFR